ncbi:MAG: transporter substrate-binding domain-containing protein [Gammaproteobacteria bacterium]|nr:transporter substrate-binding domain-containing protein [Gammaproteobacteria bacterium]
MRFSSEIGEPAAGELVTGRVKWLLLLTLLLLPGLLPIFSNPLNAGTQTVRIGVLKFGTINWEMEVIQRHQLAEKAGVDLQIVRLGSTQALKVALQGGVVDAVVGDWLWAARQLEFKRDYYFYPYSTSAASLVVDPVSGIASFDQLAGRRIGVAGGPLNKSWVLYRAYARRVHNLDLASAATIKFAAPPMLNALLQQQELDAVINFWHYSAELNAAGMATMLTMDELLQGVGVDQDVPLLGWLFSRRWGDEHADAINDFLAISAAAKQLLLHSDREWELLESMARIDSEALKHALRDQYRAGIPAGFGRREQQAMGQLFAVLKEEGGADMVGKLAQLPEAIFWPSPVIAQ